MKLGVELGSRGERDGRMLRHIVSVVLALLRNRSRKVITKNVTIIVDITVDKKS